MVRIKIDIDKKNKTFKVSKGKYFFILKYLAIENDDEYELLFNVNKPSICNYKMYINTEADALSTEFSGSDITDRILDSLYDCIHYCFKSYEAVYFTMDYELVKIEESNQDEDFFSVRPIKNTSNKRNIKAIELLVQDLVNNKSVSLDFLEMDDIIYFYESFKKFIESIGYHHDERLLKKIECQKNNNKIYKEKNDEDSMIIIRDPERTWFYKKEKDEKLFISYLASDTKLAPLEMFSIVSFKNNEAIIVEKAISKDNPLNEKIEIPINRIINIIGVNLFPKRFETSEELIEDMFKSYIENSSFLRDEFKKKPIYYLKKNYLFPLLLKYKKIDSDFKEGETIEIIKALKEKALKI